VSVNNDDDDVRRENGDDDIIVVIIIIEVDGGFSLVWSEYRENDSLAMDVLFFCDSFMKYDDRR